ncbi:MAG: hypothetical protein H5U40_15010, partial [Polyangiaceae bacterium]|nr:hypothetical protein [Polyangiaceae bacterium]
LTGPILHTTAGHAALLGGTYAPTHIAFGTSTWSPTESATALVSEAARVPLSGTVEQVGTDAILHLTSIDSSASVYIVREIGIFQGATMIGVYSQATDIAAKASGSDFLFSLDIVIANGTASSITLPTTSYQLPAASETESGLVERATQAEVNAGVDAVRYVSPATLAGRTATDARTGVVELATVAETQAGTDSARAVTPAGLAGRTATDTRTGIVELATPAEVQTGTDTTRAVTPAGMASLTATDARRGLVELATAAEVQGGTDTARAVTPAGLASLTATTSRRGLVELATLAESATGSSTVLAVTPAALGATKARFHQRASASYAAGAIWTETTFADMNPSQPYLVTVSFSAA